MLVGCCGYRALVIVTVTYILSWRHTIATAGQTIITETTEVFTILFTKACVWFLIFRPFKSPQVLVCLWLYFRFIVLSGCCRFGSAVGTMVPSLLELCTIQLDVQKKTFCVCHFLCFTSSALFIVVSCTL